MRTFHTARTPDDWLALTGKTIRFHTYADPSLDTPGDHRGVLAGVGTFAGVVRVVLDGRFIDVDRLTVVEELSRKESK